MNISYSVKTSTDLVQLTDELQEGCNEILQSIRKNKKLSVDASKIPVAYFLHKVLFRSGQKSK